MHIYKESHPISFSDVLWVIRLRDSWSRNWVTQRDQRWWWWSTQSLTENVTDTTKDFQRGKLFFTVLHKCLFGLYSSDLENKSFSISNPQESWDHNTTPNFGREIIRQPLSSGYSPLCDSRCQPPLRLSLWLREARVWVGGHWAVTPARPAASSERSAQVRSNEN